jgi:hypothetical protein
VKSANRHRITTALFCAGFVVLNSPRVVIAQSGSAGGSIGNDEKSLSGSRETSPERPARKPTEETHRSRPSSGSGGRGNFDGPWAFTSTGCSGAGTTVAVISGGQFATQFSSGAVSPNGMIHSAGAGNGLAFTATGRLVGNSGGGTFKRSDGCNGRWSAIRQ